ncbi:fungal hydrophobin-domain-containing protein [Irpex rosettiformis]|uniref:Fungal hydrophobin-domain-containing protein n=1 Tax=Irpex rosettiformis TaxID=378272 RepID=A0ACB8UI66_9APHY|nr:fungal hydrophobin-domain-containing protein [Irpex rosettiformis]
MHNRILASVLCVMYAFFVLAAATPTKLFEIRGGTLPTTSATTTTTITVSAPAATVTSASQCGGTASLQCCEQAVAANSILGRALFGLLGLVVTELDILLGLNCNPIGAVSVGSGDDCSATPVCCENNSVNVPISIGCVVITL